MRLASGHHPEQAILELRAARQVGSPVAGVHVPDAHQQGRSDISPPLRPETPRGNRDRAMHARQRDAVLFGHDAVAAGVRAALGCRLIS